MPTICCFVPGEKVPVKGGEWAGGFSVAKFRVLPIPLAVGAHAVDRGATSGVGLRHHGPTVSVDTHANDVGCHDPFGDVDEVPPHPREERLGIDTGHESEVAQHHESRNVVDRGAGVNTERRVLRPDDIDLRWVAGQKRSR